MKMCVFFCGRPTITTISAFLKEKKPRDCLWIGANNYKGQIIIIMSNVSGEGFEGVTTWTLATQLPTEERCENITWTSFPLQTINEYGSEVRIYYDQASKLWSSWITPTFLTKLKKESTHPFSCKDGTFGVTKCYSL